MDNNIILMSISRDDLSKMIEGAVKRIYEPSTSLKHTDDSPRLIDKHEAARLLGCSISTIDKMRRDGRLERIKIGRAARFKLAEINAIIENKKGPYDE